MLERIRQYFYIYFTIGIEINGGRHKFRDATSNRRGMSWTFDFIPLHWGWKTDRDLPYTNYHHRGPFYFTTNKKENK